MRAPCHAPRRTAQWKGTIVFHINLEEFRGLTDYIMASSTRVRFARGDGAHGWVVRAKRVHGSMYPGDGDRTHLPDPSSSPSSSVSPVTTVTPSSSSKSLSSAAASFIFSPPPPPPLALAFLPAFLGLRPMLLGCVCPSLASPVACGERARGRSVRRRAPALGRARSCRRSQQECQTVEVHSEKEGFSRRTEIAHTNH